MNFSDISKRHLLNETEILILEEITTKLPIRDLAQFILPEDMASVDQLASDIYDHRDRKIYLVGLGFSNIITSYFTKRLAELDILAYDGAPIDNIVSNSLPSVLIFFSKTGKTDDLVQIADSFSAGADCLFINEIRFGALSNRGHRSLDNTCTNSRMADVQ